MKDAGDDPDVTHGATIIATVRPQAAGTGVTFHAGEGVGTITKPGLPIAPGEAAINPVPRQMMRDVVAEICAEHLLPPDIAITISVPDGGALAVKTWNPRLGITGGLSILGTTGIVHPFSCAAWIHSIHRGIDVARALGTPRIIAATGSTSEDAARRLFDVPDTALIDMGDFAGGLLKYLRQHPVPHLVLAGGFAKFVKLAQGALDLHSARSQVDFDWLANHFPPDMRTRISIGEHGGGSAWHRAEKRRSRRCIRGPAGAPDGDAYSAGRTRRHRTAGGGPAGQGHRPRWLGS